MKQHALNLDSDAFNAFKNDFKMILNNTLNTMQQKDVNNATISVKFDVALEEAFAPDHAITAYPADREIVSPCIRHKITATMQFKSEKTGSVGGLDYELVWDKEENAFVMRNVNDQQISMFDGEAPKSEPPKALPENVIEAEFSAIENDNYTYELSENGDSVDGYPELLQDAIDLAISEGKASITLLQRHLHVSYVVADALMSDLTKQGILGEYIDSSTREVIV